MIIITDVTASHVSTCSGSLPGPVWSFTLQSVCAGARAERHSAGGAKRSLPQVPAPQRGLPRPFGESVSGYTERRSEDSAAGRPEPLSETNGDGQLGGRRCWELPRRAKREECLFQLLRDLSRRAGTGKKQGETGELSDLDKHSRKFRLGKRVFLSPDHDGRTDVCYLEQPHTHTLEPRVDLLRRGGQPARAIPYAPNNEPLTTGLLFAQNDDQPE